MDETHKFISLITYCGYQAPWLRRAGDDIRIHAINKCLTTITNKLIAFNLSHSTDTPLLSYHDHVSYYTFPRKFYRIIAQMLRYKNEEDYNQLILLTQPIDELITSMKLIRILKYRKVVYIFGTSLLPSLLRLFGYKNKIVYDALSNYAQTLYILSRKSIKEYIKYSLWLPLIKLQLKSADLVIYPARHDLENAKEMFKVRNAVIVENPITTYYHDLREYLELRGSRNDYNRPYFILLAGRRWRVNEEAVKLTINVFNDMREGKFKLFITGPWKDLQRLVRNPSIDIRGVVSNEELKRLLAISDIGLSPIFSHVAGTFLKVLTYISSGLDLIVTPKSLLGIDLNMLRGRKVFIVRNKGEYEKAIQEIVENWLKVRTEEKARIQNIYTADRVGNVVCERLKQALQKLEAL